MVFDDIRKGNEKHMIKMVVTDVDGTLVKESTLDINPEYYDVIRKLTEKGIKVVMASGRQYESIRKLIEPVQDLVWYIADGGATIKTDKELEVVREIPKEWIEKICQDALNIPGMDVMISTPEKTYVSSDKSQLCKIIRDNYKFHVDYKYEWREFPEEPVNKISLFHPDMIEKYTDKYFIPKWEDKLHMSIAGEWWLDCMMPGINKGTAMQKIMDKLGVIREEVMATGDNPNDLEMIELAGRGLAVATAHPRVKEIADGIIPSYLNDGVLQEWRKLL